MKSGFKRELFQEGDVVVRDKSAIRIRSATIAFVVMLETISSDKRVISSLDNSACFGVDRTKDAGSIRRGGAGRGQ